MTSPKPAPKGSPRIRSADLTTKGQPRKRSPGAGRPVRSEPRTKTMPRITIAAHQLLGAIAAHIARPGRAPCLADAIEHAARVAHAKIKL